MLTHINLDVSIFLSINGDHILLSIYLGEEIVGYLVWRQLASLPTFSGMGGGG